MELFEIRLNQLSGFDSVFDKGDVDVLELYQARLANYPVLAHHHQGT